jgi:hypothetical protein
VSHPKYILFVSFYSGILMCQQSINSFGKNNIQAWKVFIFFNLHSKFYVANIYMEYFEMAYEKIIKG